MREIENAIAAAQVLSFRLPMLWAMAFSPTPERRAEAVRMIAEKQMAVAEGLNAAALSALATWMKLASGQSVSASTAASRMVKAATRPGERRMRANARRLSRRRKV
ncbi:hypothetical protein G5V57_09670 [Nordella sp. HKS 07]|uniref:hypothetical protein n=1 Tax=Nordella sp. HKS 07 TaxID=2712222 RepID=UPI0013E196B4|nr:hypothetical protein [Nordella sp. HKS 07]QIG47962.1 hypothetical protein G5V57_09670 [Nordella sp. HKS 07]